MYDTEDPSMISTVPTDLTVTTDSEATKVEDYLKDKRPSKRKDLVREMSSLKISVAEKNTMIERLQSELRATVKRMEAMEQEHKATKIRLEMKIYQQEQNLKVRGKRSMLQLEQYVTRVQELEVANSRLEIHADHLKESLNNLHLTELEYEEVKNKPEIELTVLDHVTLRVYKEIWPLKTKHEEFKVQKERLQREADAYQRENERLVVEVERYREEKGALQRKKDTINSKYQAVYRRLEDAEPLIRNADQTRTERDKLLKIKAEMEKNISEMSEKLKKAQDKVNNLNETQQQLQLIKKDKGYLTDQVNLLKSKVHAADEKNEYYKEKLRKAEDECELLLSRFVMEKDASEQRVREEIERANLSASSKLERAHAQAKETYDQKMRMLEAERSRYQSQKEEAERKEKEAKQEYQQLLLGTQQDKIKDAKKVSELEALLTISRNENDHGELERVQLEEQLKSTRESNLQLSSKLDEQTKQMLKKEKENDAYLMKLENELKSVQTKLDVYNVLEDELDKMVANEAADKGISKDLKLVPTSSQRRLEYSFLLMQKLIKAEQSVSWLQRQSREAEDREKDFKEKVHQMETQLNLTNQPQSFLISSIRSRDDEIRNLKLKNEYYKGQLQDLQQKYTSNVAEKNQINQDLERMMANREELESLKKTVQQLSHQRNTL